MSVENIPLLMISDDQELHSAVDDCLKSDGFEITSKLESVVAMNGTAHPLAAKHDVVVFDTDTLTETTKSAIQDLCAKRATGSIMVALAHDDLPLSKQRELKRLGADEVLPRETVADDLPAHLRQWRERREASLPTVWTGQATEGKVIAVAQARGGIGASTLAVNLADSLLAKRGLIGKRNAHDVVVVDLDFQFGSIAAQLDLPESDALWRMAMEGTTPDASFVEQAMVLSDQGLSVITAPARYGPLEAIQPDQIARLLDVLRRTHDYIIVDLPHALVSWIDPVLSRSDKLMLTTDVCVPSVRATRKLMDFFLAEHPDLNIELVALQEKKPLVLGAHHRAAMELLDRKFAHWVPEDRRAAKAAIDLGKPLSDVSPRSSLTKAVKKIALSTKDELPPRMSAAYHRPAA